MSEQNSIDLATLRQDRADLDEEIAAAEARADDEETPTPEVEPTPAAVETPTQTALIAAINKLETEGKFTETGPLKAQLLEIQSGFSGLSQTPTAAPEVPTVAELRKQIDAHEAAGNWTASSALKSQLIQRMPVEGVSQ